MKGVELREEFDRVVEHEVALARRYREQLTNMGIRERTAIGSMLRLQRP